MADAVRAAQKAIFNKVALILTKKKKKPARPLLSNTELKNYQKRESKPPNCTFSKLI